MTRLILASFPRPALSACQRVCPPLSVLFCVLYVPTVWRTFIPLRKRPAAISLALFRFYLLFFLRLLVGRPSLFCSVIASFRRPSGLACVYVSSAPSQPSFVSYQRHVEIKTLANPPEYYCCCCFCFFFRGLILALFPASVSFLLFSRVCLVFCFPSVYLIQRVRELARTLRGLRWPEGHERFRGGSFHQRDLGHRRPHRSERQLPVSNCIFHTSIFINACVLHDVTHIAHSCCFFNFSIRVFAKIRF